MTRNEMLAKAAAMAIDDLFGDTSVSPEVARDNLQLIIDDCKVKIDSLDLEDVQ